MAEQGDVGEAVRGARRARGWTLRGLAQQVGVSAATMSAVENGRTALTVDRLERIADVLGVRAADLLPGGRRVVAIEAAPEAGRESWRSFSEVSMGPVLDGATRAFVRKGFHATTMREVAAESGLSVAGVYHHHDSKEHILVTLLDRTMAEIAWRLEAARSEGVDAVDALARMVESLALFHAVRSDLAFLGASEMRALPDPDRERIARLRSDVQHALERQALLCLDAGELEVDDPSTALRAVATMCTSLPSWFRPGGHLDAETVARRYADYALALLGARRRQES